LLGSGSTRRPICIYRRGRLPQCHRRHRRRATGFSRAKLCLAVTTARYNDIVTATGLIAATASDTRAGGTVGAGLEYGFFPGCSVAVEYDHFFMGTRNLQFSSLGNIAGLPPSGSGVFTDRIRQDVDLVTVRINYTFGGPAIAKY
jgi:outer membrane immunogenic protein